MLKSHEKFHSANGKRQILVADDEFINRELMRAVLQDGYDLLFAADGREALDAMRTSKDTLSLVLLDLMMPVMSGMEMLRQAKADPEIARIPIIVISADQDSEIECLNIGATDFIPKPYPAAGVILARVRRTIELSEDRDIIQSTERDPLTGLYNREYFYRYAEQWDQYHRDAEMDAIVVDVNHFHMINERFGTDYGDEVLRRIGTALRAAVEDRDGIVCRREADTFLVYCPHGIDYEAMLDDTSFKLMEENEDGTLLWLRMGVYPSVDKEIDIGRRFDHAKLAADTIRGSFTRRVGFYDSEMHANELYSEQLIQDFDVAIRERQFVVFYQPKFDVRHEEPFLASAEALVRWQHPKLGMVSPGVFIPLFEENGLIQRLDLYVWRETARQIKEWERRLGYKVPVSVNVSRIDMYDPHLVETFAALLGEYDLDARDMLLEITESAYTQDSKQIIETVGRLRDLGFRVEMDDFGTGYSSLSMISSLPIDALKLDMQFIRNAFSGRQDTRMLEVIIDIADYLSVPVIAEGVETEDQMLVLKAMGCDYVQGFYFSRPVPAADFEPFVIKRRGQEQEEYGVAQDERLGTLWQSTITYASIVQALAVDYFSIYYVDTTNDTFVEYSSHEQRPELGVKKSGEDFFGLIRKNIGSHVHPDDVDMFLSVFTKENVLASLEKNRTFTLTFRLMVEGVPTYVHMKATRIEGRSDMHIVIGVSDVDEQMRREQEHARALRMANQDALTGVKSKHAYAAEERAINRAIKAGEQVPFAVVVCDVNDLKTVNDTRGHVMGDQYIKDACMVVCNIFKHSPVFRVGGDEFTAILRGSDYDARDELMHRLEKTNEINRRTGEVTVAGGLAVWDPETEHYLADVFARADAAMYDDKKRYKGLGASGRDAGTEN